MEKVKFVTTSIFLGIICFFNSLSIPLLLLIITNIIDIITGLLKSLHINENITFKKLIWGLIKKFSMYLLIIIGYIIDIIIIYTVENFNIAITNQNIFESLITIWLILDELLSILKNFMILEVPMPNFLIKIVKKLKNKIDDTENV
ncbi:MAG TPA: phage holin family protein [Bacilli bacterium]|nr:phage holin family protein [Bacilli bacterium]